MICFDDNFCLFVFYVVMCLNSFISIEKQKWRHAMISNDYSGSSGRKTRPKPIALQWITRNGNANTIVPEASQLRNTLKLNLTTTSSETRDIFDLITMETWQKHWNNIPKPEPLLKSQKRKPGNNHSLPTPSSSLMSRPQHVTHVKWTLTSITKCPKDHGARRIFTNSTLFQQALDEDNTEATYQSVHDVN